MCVCVSVVPATFACQQPIIKHQHFSEGPTAICVTKDTAYSQLNAYILTYLCSMSIPTYNLRKL